MGRYELILIGLFILFGLWMTPFMLESTQAYNSTALVNTTVNITNAAPMVKLVRIPTPTNLVAYNNRTIYCNVTTYDFDNDTLVVNASFHYSTSGPQYPTDQNSHYKNISCTRTSIQGFYMNWSCGFRVNYFANNGTWYCNSTASDASAYSSNSSIAGTINPLVALKATPLIDYGNLPTLNISSEQIANITNGGNRNINISVTGFGSTLGDGLAMVCDSGSIGVGNEAYDRSSGSPFAFMNPLTASSVKIDNFWVNQRVSETNDSLNRTYWRIQIPTGAGGVCNGKLLFTASDRGG